jgi:predicted ester cyclase
MTHDGLVRRRVEAIDTGDVEVLGEVLAPDVVTHYGSGETVHGLEALAGLLAGFGAFRDLVVTIDDLAVDGDRVGARYTSRGRQKGEFLGIPDSGARVEFGGADIPGSRTGRSPRCGRWMTGRA